VLTAFLLWITVLKFIFKNLFYKAQQNEQWYGSLLVSLLLVTSNLESLHQCFFFYEGELMIGLRHLLSILKFRECFFYANKYHKKVSWWCLSCGQSSDGFPEGQTGVGYLFLVAQVIKNFPAMQRTQVWSLDCKDPLEKGMATHPSILAWRIPWTGALWSTVHGVTNSISFKFVLGRKWAVTIHLPGKDNRLLSVPLENHHCFGHMIDIINSLSCDIY